MPDCAIGLMAKFPIKGKVKTRLGKDIGDELALQVYEKLLDNAVETLHSLPDSTFLTSVFIDPPDYIDKFENHFRNIKKYYLQEGIDLGARMHNAIEKLLSINSIDKAILIGADIPEIDRSILSKAFDSLKNNDLVIGPTYDGGYYLIGMKQLHQELFTNLNWSTDTVLEKTLNIAKDRNLKVACLKTLSDIDDLSDLKRFDEYHSIIK